MKSTKGKCANIFYTPSPLQASAFPLPNSKGKGHPITGHEGPEEEQMYSYTLPSTSALDMGCGQHHASAALPPEKTRYPLYRRLGGLQGRSGRMRKISPPPGFDPRTVQPVASRYTDWAIPAPPHPNSPSENKWVSEYGS